MTKEAFQDALDDVIKNLVMMPVLQSIIVLPMRFLLHWLKLMRQ